VKKDKKSIVMMKKIPEDLPGTKLWNRDLEGLNLSFLEKEEEEEASEVFVHNLSEIQSHRSDQSNPID
jgi:hypothetical protein